MGVRFESVCAFVRKAYGEMEGRTIREDEISNVAVSFDGTWQKRG